MKKTLVVLGIFMILSLGLAFELNVGAFYSFNQTWLVVAEVNSFSQTANTPNTTTGFTAMFLTDFSNRYLGMLGGIAKYDMKLDFGKVSLYGAGGMLFPITDFGFEKITSIVRVGAKYYAGSIVFNTGIFSFYLSDNSKVEGVEFLLGYTF
ncbi:hypothetical protein SAMN04488510_13612 [Fervidobacterium changbaicum]|uniref:Uncharacterized protein n=2 Tax=Fervidobacterium TaxID=2422 RepID=A0AAI8CLQ1_FERIS|nr:MULTISPECIES: hypothetical protein [Fervidobacterium]AMW32659.1 hypothetical protein NA23_04760 [Fervidobacterium islandicum]QAV32693.1 hypothetical protein CBS1_02280 [Fervidobacterium changbaicum]SDH80283.1 hypothetical protein SAMN04488510_13612 [Fervidobacterium changbaicum]